ncbi:MAG TPA: cytochrome c [Woeseiaceae bacterium]
MTIERSAAGGRALCCAAVLCLLTTAADAAGQDLVERGEYLVRAGGCITCHVAEEEGAVPFAGGRAIESPFGTFYSPNITPDEETGIGSWSDEDFLNAFWNGVNPDGDHYFPAFPYTSYTGITREDLLAMKAYLFSLEPVRQPNKEHDLSVLLSSRLAAGLWKRRYFEPGRFEPDPDQSREWNRGAYLVRHLGHCGECHTPRSRFGALERDRALTGNPDGPEGDKVPNITADPEDGIGEWSTRDIEYFLESGMLPDGDFAGGAMADVIDEGTSHLTDADRHAIAVYLKSLTPPP